MFQKKSKKWTALLLTALLLCLPVSTLHAEGTTSIALSGNSVEVGKKVTVTITGSDTSKLSLRYNNNALKFVGCSASGFSTDGNTISFSGKSATVTFEAQDSGAGDLVVSSDVLSGSSASVQVTKPAAAAEEKPAETKPAEQEKPRENNSRDSASNSSKASSEDGDFTINGKPYVLSERYKDSEIPSGYTRKTMKIHGGTYRELTNGKITLVYLKPADKIEGSGEFYVFDPDKDSVSEYKVLGKSDYYLTVSKADKVPEVLEGTKVKIQKKVYNLFKVKGQENDFYYVYGTDQAGNKGWHCYDSLLGTIQRANMDLLSGTSLADEQGEGDQQDDGKASGKSVKKKKGEASSEFDPDAIISQFGGSRNVMAVAIFIGVVLLIIILDILLFRRKIRDDEDEQEEEFPEEQTEVLQVDHILEAEDFEEANKPHKSRKFLKREKPADIWDTKEKVFSDDTSDLSMVNDESSQLKKQVFRGRSSEGGSEGDEGKVDVIDFNDL